MIMRLDTGDRLLFVGDSVTSCGYENIAAPWGAGFVLFVDVQLSAATRRRKSKSSTAASLATPWSTWRADGRPM
jgi:hypothetical protein